MPRQRSFIPTPGRDVVEDTGRVKAVVLTDTYAYHKVSNEPTSRRIEVDPPAGTSSAKGVEIEVSDQEFERGSSTTPPSLAKAGSKEAKRFFGEHEPVDPKVGLTGLSDGELAAIITRRNGSPDGMNRDEMIGFVAGTPGNPSSNPASTA